MSWNYNISTLEKNSFVLTKQNPYLKKSIEEFQFMYQPKLDLTIPFQYGIEIEFTESSLEEVEEKIKDFYQVSELVYGQDWYVDVDESVTDYLYGGELKSPISYNDENDWYELKQLCEIVQSLEGTTDEKCSIHLHVDFHRLDFQLEDWNRFLKLWCAYEDVIYEFSRVGKEKIRDYYLEYATPIRDYILNVMSKGEASNAITGLVCSLDKSCCLNMKNLYHSLSGVSSTLPTIEFRSCNGTLNPIFIQNIVRLFAKMLEAVKLKGNKLDFSIEKRLFEECPDCCEKALELSNLIFNNDFEKLSFLKQCMMYEKNNTCKR